MKAKQRKQRQAFRQLHLETLEARQVFHGDEGAFAGYGSLTFSFAPDNTQVGREINQLPSEFSALATPQVWQEAIARAFQKWSMHSDVNFGLVTDNGAASGVYGPTRGDERFGDVRITGFDFAEDTYAEAVSENSRSVGTWSGDVFFNTAAPWPNIEAIESAALHEVGHILGLGHSSDPNSPMHVHGPSGNLELTPSDIFNLQALHGPKSSDPNEGSHGNNSIKDATPIRGSTEDVTGTEGFRGDQVWIQFGDLMDAADRDVFVVETAVGYTGPLAIEVRSGGISLARLAVSITDKDGNVLAESLMSDGLYGKIVLGLDETLPETKYYVHVSATNDPFWASGDYSVTVASDQRLQADGESIAAWARKAHRWYYDSDRAEKGFTWLDLGNGDDEPSDDDGHSDDSLSSAREMPMALSTDSRIVFQTVGTISDLTDVDFYVVEAPENLGARTEVTIDLEALTLDGIVPNLALVDERGNAIPAEVRVRGFGQTQMILESPQERVKYFLRLDSGNVDEAHRTGSIALSVTFGLPTAPPEVLLEGVLDANTSSVDREWYIARPQLFGLSLRGDTADASAEGTVWVSIYDSERRLVAGLVAPLNDLRSAPGLFLDPGTHYFQIAASVPSGELPEIAFSFRTERPSQPIGPLIGDKKVQPMYLCPGSTTEYCYPNTNTRVANTQQVGTAPVAPLPAPSKVQVVSASQWFWDSQLLPTNPSNAVDADGDGIVSPLDVLLIINVINSRGVGPVPTPPEFLGYLDCNANGTVDPLDVLMVINTLNR